MTDTLNLNSADCLQTVNDIGVSHIHNICTGAVIDVPWGSLDWAGSAFALFIVGVIVAFFSKVIFLIITGR